MLSLKKKYTHKSGRVVVTDGLGVAVGLEDGVGLDDPVLQVSLLLLLRSCVLLHLVVATEDGEVGDDLFGVFGLAGARLAGNEHGLVLGIGHHLLVGAVGNGKQVGRNLVPPLTDVHLDNPVGVDGVTLVWVDDNAEEARVRLDNTGGIIILKTLSELNEKLE